MAKFTCAVVSIVVSIFPPRRCSGRSGSPETRPRSKLSTYSTRERSSNRSDSSHTSEKRPMTNKTKILFLVIAGAALSASSYNAAAQPTEGYWDSSAGVVWKDPFGLCWRSGAWTPAMATAECDPELVKKPEPKPMAAPPPAPPPAPAMAAPP